MAYKIFLESRAEKDLKKIPKEFQKGIIAEILKLKINPRLFKSRKISHSEDYYRIRFGDFRIIYEIDDRDKRINIFRIRHRKEVYSNL